jgi:hypothetical protein
MRHPDEELEHEEAFPRLTREVLALLEAAGERRALTEGQVVSRAGEVAREDHGSTTERAIRGSRRGASGAEPIS